jgi:hypothetical protein
MNLRKKLIKKYYQSQCDGPLHCSHKDQQVWGRGIGASVLGSAYCDTACKCRDRSTGHNVWWSLQICIFALLTTMVICITYHNGNLNHLSYNKNLFPSNLVQQEPLLGNPINYHALLNFLKASVFNNTINIAVLSLVAHLLHHAISCSAWSYSNCMLRIDETHGTALTGTAGGLEDRALVEPLQADGQTGTNGHSLAVEAMCWCSLQWTLLGQLAISGLENMSDLRVTLMSTWQSESLLQCSQLTVQQ